VSALAGTLQLELETASGWTPAALGWGYF